MSAEQHLGIAIIGCGLIGRKRAATLGGARLVACADILPERARTLAATVPGAVAVPDWREAVSRKDVNAVIVATPNNLLAEVALGAVTAGKHALVEKPAARSLRELEPVIEASRRSGALVRVGFNHRYHPAFRKAREIYDSGVMGEMMYVRARYGHGGRIGYEREWRADPKLSGGGELLDQGVHLIDLARWFLGDFPHVTGFAHTYFWNMPVEDNAFMLLRTAEQRAAFLHVSWTEWKNMFSFELYGKTAKLNVEGLGGSYGPERLTLYRMLPQMGPPEITTWDYPGPDDSWQAEFAEFCEDIRLKRPPAAGLADARAALDVVGRIYREMGYDYNA